MNRIDGGVAVLRPGDREVDSAINPSLMPCGEAMEAARDHRRAAAQRRLDQADGGHVIEQGPITAIVS